jgi:hypothetical protein
VGVHSDGEVWGRGRAASWSSNSDGLRVLAKF